MSTTITDKAGLQAMNDTLDGDFVLGADIDASGTGSGFEPIGSTASPFTGTLDGTGYTITGLFINRTSEDVGLFDTCDGATLSNITLADVDITTDDGTASGLVANAGDTDITTCTVSGSVTTGGTSDFVGLIAGLFYGSTKAPTMTGCSCSGTVIGAHAGGLIGWVSGTVAGLYLPIITKCYSTAVVTASKWGGGLIGYTHSATISKCYATGNVTSDDLAGGFIGKTCWGGGTKVTTISDCYAMGDVQGTTYASGFIDEGNTTTTVTSCYSTGALTGTNKNGFMGGTATVTISYWDTETSGTETSTYGTGKTTAQMKLQATYTDWDFTCTWNTNICLNSGYPYLRWTAADGGGETRTYTLPPIYDEKGRVPKGATARAYRSDTGALVETETLDSSGQATFTELPNDTDVSIHITWGGTTTTHKTVQIQSTIMGVTEGGTGASDEYNARSNLGLGSEDSPQFTGIELGHATDTTIARAAAGRATIEGVGVVRGPASATDNIIPRFNLTTGDLIQQTGITADDSNNVSGVAKLTTSSDVELGHASDTTVHRESAGKVSVEGTVLTRAAACVIAASNSYIKTQADATCDGTDD